MSDSWVTVLKETATCMEKQQQKKLAVFTMQGKKHETDLFIPILEHVAGLLQK